MTDRPQPLNNLLQDSDDCLSRLLGRASQLQRVNQLLLQQLGQPVAQHLRLANLRGGTAYIQVDSPAWQARTHYLKPQLLGALRELGLAVDGIEILVVAPVDSTQPQQRPTRTIPDEARELLRAFAANQQDARLAKALSRLAEAGQTPTPPSSTPAMVIKKGN